MKKIEVNQSTCIGCGACVQIAPQAFELNENGLSVPKTEVTKEVNPQAFELNENGLSIPIVGIIKEVTPEIIEAMEVCPVNAITIEDVTK